MSDFLDQIVSLSPKRLALLALEQHAELEAIRQAQVEPIAIVGIGCRFPGDGAGPDAFWRLLRDGVDCITEVPPDRWEMSRYYDPDPEAAGKMYCKYGAFLSQVDRFDAHFFGVAPREAAQMDPQQHLVLEVAWEALEHAGLPPGGMAGSQTGVFLGACSYDYSLLQLSDPGRIEAYTTSGAAPSILANRLSYLLDLQGPSLTVDTACSSSLVTVHLACQSLRQKECDVALAGGVNLILSPVASIALSKGRMLAPDGRCKTFDAGADGYARGEGCGVVVLKRLSDALAARNSIRGLIRGSAVNQDGYGNGLTAPNLLAQQAVIRRALEQAHASPDQIGYIEAHGTGTALGDPIEVEALRATYGQAELQGRTCAIGSVKTNIGHLEGAAGIAGLIKAVLALEHEAIPPHLHFRNLNPHISLQGTPFVIPTGIRAWPAGEQPRYAAVSSFGFGGTNAHIILSEAPHAEAAPPVVDRPLHLLTLSAKTETALEELARRYTDTLESPALSWPDVCFTANAGRSHFAERLAVVAASAGTAREKLAASLAGETPPGLIRGQAQTGRASKVAFLFTGQGAQYVGMGRRLYETQPVFRAALGRCEKLLQPYLAQPLLSLLYPAPDGSSLLDQTAYTQPALFALEHALAELWGSWGVVPGAVLGHSVGEYVAACIAGVFTLEDALKLVATRGRLMQALPREGAMAVAFASERESAEAIGGYGDSVAIAALNSPTETVLSGTRSRLEAVLRDLGERGIKTRLLEVSHAFHSPLMEPVLDSLESAAANTPMAEPRLALISNLTGRPVERGVVTQARYWRRHARQTVRFAAGIRALHAQGYRQFVEIGPHPVLLGSGRQCVPEDDSVWLPSLRRGVDDWQQLLGSLGTLYVNGGSVDWRSFDSDYPRRRVSLPTYPFQRQQYRIRAANTAPDWRQWLYEIQWQAQVLPGGPAEQPPGRWLILADRGGNGAALSQLLEAHGETCVLVFAGEEYQSSEDFHRLLRQSPGAWRGAVHLWSLDAAGPGQDDGTAIEAAALSGCTSALHLVQAVVKAGVPAPRLWLVTCAARLAGTPLWGLGRVIALEHPELRCTLADMDANEPASVLPSLAAELLVENREDQVSWRSGVRHVARLAASAAGPANGVSVSAEGTYLITGGLGALGLEVARWLVSQGARHLVLLGRKAPSSQARAAVDALERAGAGVTIMQADVAQAADLKVAFDSLRRTHPPLRGVVHAAGVLGDGVLVQQTSARFAEVMAPKIAGAWNLHTLTQDLPLDFLVFFSSMASVLGSPGQGNYAAANAFLDALAHYRRARGLPALSINWGPWAAAGMASSQDERQQRRREAQGIRAVSPEEGAQVLQALIGHAAAQIGVLPVEWSQLLQQFDGGPPPLFTNLAQNVVPLRRPKPDVRQRLASVPESKREEFLSGHVRQQAAEVLGLEPKYPLNPNKPLKELGLDSLMAVELAKVLGAGIELPLPATLVFTYPTVRTIAAYLLAELFPQQAAQESPQEEKHRQLVAEVQQLSDSELEAFVYRDSARLEDRR